MNTNLAYQDEPWEEMLDGKIVLMSPRPSVSHYRVVTNIYRTLTSLLEGKTCEAFIDGIDVYLSETDRVVPDGMIVCNKDIVKKDGIHGAPDFVVEVLSPSTAKNDRGYKKDMYERAGVREYWIVEPTMRMVEVYLLSDGKYYLDEVYRFYPEGEELTEEERDARRDSIPLSLYDDFSIPMEDIFARI